MPGVWATITFAFILGVELFDYVGMGRNPQEPGWGAKALRMPCLHPK